MEAIRKVGRALAPVFVVALAIIFFLVATQPTAEQTPVTSKYHYNRAVFPRFPDHCSA
jgi:branched-subunit amino acid permease